MDKTNLLPVPIHYEFLSDRRLKDTEIPQVAKVQRLDDVLTHAEQERFKKDLISARFKEEGYVIKLQNSRILLYAPSKAGYYYGTNTINKLVKNSEGDLPEILIVDYPTFAIRGFMEGFTGSSWVHDRMDMIEKCANYGFNTFVLGPNDFHLLGSWREPFPENYKQHLAHVLSVAKRNFVKFCYKIIPFGIDMASDSDVEAFKRKASELADLGIDAVIIALDDFFILQRTKGYAKVHASFANKISETLEKRDIALFLIPAVYYGISKGYHTALGKELSEYVKVGWTGRKIESKEVTLEDVKTLEDMLRRKPFLGLNFPVLNEIPKKRRVHLGPLMGLDARLSEHLTGISFNFMSLPFASLISGATCADYAWNPNAYNPKISIKNSCASLGSMDLLKLVELNPETTVDPHAIHPITKIVYNGSRYMPLSNIEPREIKQLKEAFETMCSFTYSLDTEKIGRELYMDLKPLLEQADRIGSLGQKIVNETISQLGMFIRFYAGIKLVAGYRFSGLKIENWILREMGFPANLIQYSRPLLDTIDTILRKRHRRQKIK